MELRTADAGGPIAYADYGGSGQTMVLVHGLGGMHLNWMAVGDQLARGYRVVAPDLIGFGATPPAGRRSSIPANLQALHRFIRVIGGGEPVILVGNSMGGLLSGFLAAESPHLVDRLVLVDPAVPNPRFEGVSALVIAFFAALMAPGVASAYLRRRSRQLGAEALVRSTLAAVCADPRRVPPDVVRAHIAFTERRIEAMPWADHVLVEAARSLLRVLVRSRRYDDRMGRVKAPTLVINGSEDRLVPLPAVRRLVSRCPHFELEVMNGIGHVPMMESPESFISVIQSWLGGAREARAG